MEKGPLVLLMSIALYLLWMKLENADNQIKEQIKILSDENRECSSEYKNLILDQWKLSNEIIEKNSKFIKDLETKISQK